VSAHTPGPWRAQIDPRNEDSWKPAQWVGVWSGETLIATYDISYAEYPKSVAENAANARLIAAAPELLMALTNMLEDGDRVDRDQAMRVILKATGKTA
jgi:hypothetical protein